MMRLTLEALLCYQFAATCSANLHKSNGKYDFGLQTGLTFRRSDIEYSAIVAPLPLVDDKPVLRREIRELHDDRDAWTLYILAMNWLQYMPQDDKFSYYQLSAIHGAPGITWNSVDSIEGSENVGYCNHVSVLFPTWHRPYLALYEQTLYKIVQFIATLWPESEREHWQSKALEFRIPYWDSCRAPGGGSSAFPDNIGGPQVVITNGPAGNQSISNPLYSYIFKPFNSSIFPEAPWNGWPETKRAPEPMLDVNAVSNNSFVARSFNMNLATFQQRLYKLFADYDDYAAFSNEGWITNSSDLNQDSLESLHDSIHIAAGGYFGHLAIIGYSAFDPFFMLHHAGVDRLFAMWQVLNPNSFIVSTPAVYSTHTSVAGSKQDSKSDLTPFRVNDTSFWNSDMVRDHEVFGYTYEEVAAKDRQQTSSWINKLYSTYSPVSLHLANHISELNVTLPNKADAVITHAHGHLDAGPTPAGRENTVPGTFQQAILSNDEYMDWSANIKANKHAYGCSYTVYLFWNVLPTDVSVWPVAQNLVGSLGVLGMKTMKGHGASKRVSGTVPLTSSLVRRITLGHVASLQAADAAEFLESELKHAIALSNGTIIRDYDSEIVSITIIGSKTKLPPDHYQLARPGTITSRFKLANFS